MQKPTMKKVFLVFALVVFTLQISFVYLFNPLRGSSNVTVTMTTCNRLGLTIITLDSLKKYNKNIGRIFMMVDCYDIKFVESIKKLYPDVSLLYPTVDHKKKDLRHMHNLQELFKHVDTEWWFHCEDDWEFTRHGFVADSIDILSNSDLYMIIGRQPNSFKPYMDYWIDSLHGVLRINAGPSGKFTSYTANPAVLNTAKVRKLIGDFSHYSGEWDISMKLGKKGKRVGIFRNHYYHHIGDGMSTMH